MIQELKKQLFRIVAWICFGTYRHFPIFGSLRASLAVIRDQGRYLVIDRNDRDEYCFPGGISWPWEKEETTLRREVVEETGLRVQHSELSFRYSSVVGLPFELTVFEAQATGNLRESWEGRPVWVTLTELEARITASQRPVVEKLAAAQGRMRPTALASAAKTTGLPLEAAATSSK
jgi:8-oxo-dGTP pyrophosphatase MutT (NUDIX family)